MRLLRATRPRAGRTRPAVHCCTAAVARVWAVLAVAALCCGMGAMRPAVAQEELIVTIETTHTDTTETFWLQVPPGYDPAAPPPLLVGWHQWGGSHLELRNATRFDSVAAARGWLLASHQGPGPTHWNNHPTQSHVVDMLDWIADRYPFDPQRLYMVGASMGGAAGMVFANNHLDPAGHRVAAAASVSGIQDCERRFNEQGNNNSMIAAFGGRPDEVPYVYHRNSAICFSDSTESMHYNARHLPLLLTFGREDSDAVWRQHAEDLYAVMHGYADTLQLHESALYGHGWSCAEEGLICDFLAGFQLPPAPPQISINADEDGRYAWGEVALRDGPATFGRFEASVDSAAAAAAVALVRNVSHLLLDLPALGFPYERGVFVCHAAVEAGASAQLGFSGVPTEPAHVLRNGNPMSAWSYDPLTHELWIAVGGTADYTVVLATAGLSHDLSAPALGRAGARLALWPLLGDRAAGFALPAAARVRWRLLDPTGRLVERGNLGPQPAGLGRFSLPTPGASGIYLLQLETNCKERVSCRFLELN